MTSAWEGTAAHSHCHQTHPPNVLVCFRCKFSHISLWHMSATAALPPVSIAPATTCSLFWDITLLFSLLYLHRVMSSAVNQSFQIWAMWLDVFKSKSLQQIQQSLELWKCFLFICVLFFPRWFSPSYYSSSSHGGPVLSLSTTSTTTVAPQPIIWWSLLVLPISSSLPCHLSFWRSATGSFVLVSGPHSCTDGTLQKLWRCT